MTSILSKLILKKHVDAVLLKEKFVQEKDYRSTVIGSAFYYIGLNIGFLAGIQLGYCLLSTGYVLVYLPYPGYM